MNRNTENKKRPQFGVRDLLLAVWAVAVGLASLRFGVAVLIAVGIPVAVFGHVIVNKKLRQISTSRKLFMGLVGFIMIALAFFILAKARPIDHFTWATLIGSVFWAILIAFSFPRSLSWFAVGPSILLTTILVCLVESANPWNSLLLHRFSAHMIQEIHRGGVGVSFLGLNFGWPGPNTAMLQEQLGPIRDEWRHLASLRVARDGNERVNCTSLIYDSDLRKILAKLPNDAARKQVLQCLTDSRNYMRVHQGLLLTCVYVLDYPPGFDKERWWNRHGEFFTREHNPKVAIQKLWGMAEATESFAPGHDDAGSPYEQFSRIAHQRRAAEYQITGAWGGDDEFGLLNEEMFALQFVKAQRDSHRADYNWAVSEFRLTPVAWWPEFNSN